MIISFKKLSEEQVKKVDSIFKEHSVSSFHVEEDLGSKFILSCKEKLDDNVLNLVTNMPGYLSHHKTTSDHPLSLREVHPQNSVIDISEGVVFGEDKTIMMAGPCAVESYDQIMRTAEYLCNLGVKVFRAGAYKPRTSTYSFQGLEEEGLMLLNKVRSQFGLKIISEVKDLSHASNVSEISDIIQVGTKSMYNFSLLRACAKFQKPILLKRGFMSTIKEFLQAADVVLAAGNPNVILCERGIRTFEPETRFCLDLGAAAIIKKKSHLPLVIDPSHAIGISAHVGDLTFASAAMGIDGLLIETHPNPAEAKSDKAQALDLQEFTTIHKKTAEICRIAGRQLA